MTAIYRKSGDIVDYTPSEAAVDAGEFVIQGNIVGITKHRIEQGELGAIATSGIFDGVAKGSGALTLGSVVYLNPSDKKVYNAAASNAYIPIGLALKAAVSDAASATILLLQGLGAGEPGDFTPMTNIPAVSAATGVALTDSTGGTSYSNHTLKAIENEYTKATIAGNFATLATEVEANRADIAAIITKLNALLSGMVTDGLMSAS